MLLWFDVCWCYGVVRMWWCGILMQAEACIRIPHTSNQSNTTHEITQQISRKLLRMEVLTLETCWEFNSEIIKQVTSSWSIFIQLVTRYLFDWLGKVTINVRTVCIEAVTGLERHCYVSMSGHILMYHWLFAPVSCAAHALQTTAGGKLGQYCNLRLHFKCSIRHTQKLRCT